MKDPVFLCISVHTFTEYVSWNKMEEWPKVEKCKKELAWARKYLKVSLLPSLEAVRNAGYLPNAVWKNVTVN